MLRFIVTWAGFRVLGRGLGSFVTLDTGAPDFLKSFIIRLKVAIHFLVPSLPTVAVILAIFDIGYLLKSLLMEKKFQTYVPASVYAALTALDSGIIKGMSTTHSKHLTDLQIGAWFQKNIATVNRFLPYYRLAQAVYIEEKKRPNTVTIFHRISNQPREFTKILPELHDEQFAIYENPEEIVFVFRGSVTRDDWFRSSLGIVRSFDTKEMKRANADLGKVKEALKKLREKQKEKTMYAVGHSLGGAIAHYIASVHKNFRAIGFMSGFNLIPEADEMYASLEDKSSGGCNRIGGGSFGQLISGCRHINFTLKGDIIGASGNRFLAVDDKNQIVKKTNHGPLHIIVPTHIQTDYVPYYHSLRGIHDVWEDKGTETVAKTFEKYKKIKKNWELLHGANPINIVHKGYDFVFR